jgi:hypothetical protein
MLDSPKEDATLRLSMGKAFDKIFFTPTKSLHNPTFAYSKFNTDTKKSIAYLRNSIAKTNINTTWSCIVSKNKAISSAQIPQYFINLGSSIGNLIPYTSNQIAMIKSIEQYHQIRRIVNPLSGSSKYSEDMEVI